MAIDSEKLKQIKKLLEKIADSYKQLGENNPMEKFDSSKIEDADSKIKELKDTLAGVQNRVDKVNTSFGDLSSTLTSVVNEMTKGNEHVKKLNKGMRGLVSEAQDLAYEEKGINRLSEKQLEKIVLRAKKSKQLAQDSAKALLHEKGLILDNGDVNISWKRIIKDLSKEEQQQLIDAKSIYKDIGGFQDELIQKAESRLAHEKKLNKQLGVAGGILKGLSKIPVLNNIVDFPEIMEKAREKTKETESGVRGLGAGFKEMGKQAISGLLNPANLALGAITMLIAALKGADKEAGELAKEMGVSYQESLALGNEMTKTALASEDILVNRKNLIGAQKSLNEYFGTGAKFSGEIAEEFASIQKRTGLSNNAMGLFTKTAMKNGKTTKGVLLDIKNTTLELNKQNKTIISVKEVQEDVAKLSHTFQLRTKGGVKELAKAVLESKALGINMEHAAAMSSSLLDFESSIQNELQAELLLGQDINLESARALALQGDIIEASKEVLKNESILKAFKTDNVIAQEAAAKAAGLTVDQLADVVYEQENLKILQDQYGSGIGSMSQAQEEYNKKRAAGMSAEEAAKEINNENLSNQLEAASVADKMAGIVTRIQDVFMSMAEPILGIVEGITNMVGGAENLANILLTIAGLYAAIKLSILGANIAKGIGLLFTKKEERAEKQKALAKAASITTAFVVNPIGAAIGLAAGLAATAYVISQMKDGKIDPKKGPVLTGPFGSVQMDPKDKAMYDADGKIKVGTDLMGGETSTKTNQKGGGAVVQNNAALLAKIDQLITINTRIAQVAGNRKQDKVTLEMFGNEVGQGINTAEREIQ